MKVLISGSSSGIGLEVAKRFLKEGYMVIGFDLKESKIDNPFYLHYQIDIKNKEDLPDIDGDIEYLFNNAGLQNSEDDIGNNLKGAINVTEKYAFNKNIKSVLFNASASARSGDEFPLYVASKAGLVGYMKNVAIRLAPYGATCNSISLGGVLTSSNDEVIKDKEAWNRIMEVTPLKKWASLEEVTDWVYFLLITNKSMSGQDLLIDNGEQDLTSTFVWPSKALSD